jgi:hypothetical protein
MLVVGAGLYLGGLPAEQRDLRLDEKRLADLALLVQVIDRKWRDTGQLPVSLEELADGQRLSRLPRDPLSGEPYAYRVTGERSYQLCALFDRASEQRETDDFWYHGAGGQCFQFTADAEPGSAGRGLPPN